MILIILYCTEMQIPLQYSVNRIPVNPYTRCWLVGFRYGLNLLYIAHIPSVGRTIFFFSTFPVLSHPRKDIINRVKKITFAIQNFIRYTYKYVNYYEMTGRAVVAEKIRPRTPSVGSGYFSKENDFFFFTFSINIFRRCFSLVVVVTRRGSFATHTAPPRSGL